MYPAFQLKVQPKTYVEFNLFNLSKCHIPGESNKVYAFRGLWNKKYFPIFKIKILIYQLKTNLDETFCLVKSHVFKDSTISKMSVRVCTGIQNSTFHSGP